MNRREFMERCAALGVSFSFFAALGCEETTGLYWDFDVAFEGKVVVIGAGAAGLAAGYLLDRYGIDFEILEANDRIGGRVKRLDGFADFPIDLGAEWIHEDPSILAALVDDDRVDASIDVIPYSPDSVANFNNGTLRRLNFGANYYSEFKFRNTTWFGFLERHIAAGLEDRIRLQTPVTQVDLSGERIVVTDASGGLTEADRVLVTVPIRILQTGGIAFIPELSDEKRAAIDAIQVPSGIKVFLEFSEMFYPDITLVGPVLAQDKIYYNAAFRKDSARNVLALFWVDEAASVLTDLDSEQEILDTVLAELDVIFDGAASSSFLQGVVENWSTAPYAMGAYSVAFSGDQEDIVARLNAPVDGRLFFAGEALSLDNGSTVPGAMQSAYESVRTLLER